MKKIKYVSFIIIIGIFLICTPVIVKAATVPWLTEQYIAEAGPSYVEYGPPLPIDANDDGLYIKSRSTITSSTMTVYSYNRFDFLDWAKASFTGTYISASVNSLFRFSYDGSIIGAGINPDSYAWLDVYDVTSAQVLYNNTSLNMDAAMHTIDIMTIAGHEISINFGAYAASRGRSDGSSTPSPSDADSERLTLNYSTTVVPEPISSILFVSGGSLLAGRRFLRKRKRS